MNAGDRFISVPMCQLRLNPDATSNMKNERVSSSNRNAIIKTYLQTTYRALLTFQLKRKPHNTINRLALAR